MYAVANSKTVNDLCEELKTYVIKKETGQPTIPYNFNTETTLLKETWASVYLDEGTRAATSLLNLRKAVADYNKAVTRASGLTPIPIGGTVLADENVRVTNMLTDLVQVQMVLIQNEREHLATL
jgi:hypothetical protein